MEGRQARPFPPARSLGKRCKLPSVEIDLGMFQPRRSHLLKAIFVEDKTLYLDTASSIQFLPEISGMFKVGWLEFNVPFQHKHGYIKDERSGVESYPLTQ